MGATSLFGRIRRVLCELIYTDSVGVTVFGYRGNRILFYVLVLICFVNGAESEAKINNAPVNHVCFYKPEAAKV